MSEKPFTTTYYLIDSFVQNKPLKDPLMFFVFFQIDLQDMMTFDSFSISSLE